MRRPTATPTTRPARSHRHLVRARLLLCAGLALLGVLAGCGGGNTADADAPVVMQQTPDYGGQTAHGFVALPPKDDSVPPQRLITIAGRHWTFTDVQRNELTLLYYGYTHCPDICPTTMADLAAAARTLPRPDRQRISVVFISTDPRRDTVKQLRRWLGQFDPAFIGIRAPIQQVITTARHYGIGVSAPKIVHGNYEVTHGAQVAVLGPGGHQLGYFKTLTASSDYAAEIRELLNEEH